MPSPTLADLNALVALLERLDADTPPRWGQMTAQHMVEHLAEIVRLSTTGHPTLEAPPPEQQERLRRFLYSDRPLPQGFVNPIFGEGLQPLRHPDLAAARAALTADLDAFDAYYAAQPDATTLHPVFGRLDGADWRQFHAKHLTHHLTQFGLLTP